MQWRKDGNLCEMLVYVLGTGQNFLIHIDQMIDTLFIILISRELNCVLKPKKLLVKLKRNINEIHQGGVFCIPLVCSLGLQNALHDHLRTCS